MTDFKAVVDLLTAGRWEAAHEIVQSDDSPRAAWAHGIVHLIEGDRSNAAYWYERASRELLANVSIENEIEAFKNESAP